MKVKTGEAEDAGTKAQIFITACGSKGSSEPQPLGNAGGADFTPGNEADFTVNFITT